LYNICLDWIEAYKYAIKLAGNPDKIVMIGDSIAADVKGAEKAGIKAILIHTPPDDSIKYYAKSILQIENILNQIFVWQLLQINQRIILYLREDNEWISSLLCVYT